MFEIIKVVHVTSELDGGGVERLLYDYCCRMKDNIYFDFVINSVSEGILEKPLKVLGFKIFRIKQLRQSFLESLKSLYHILKEGRYDIIHVHSGYKAVFALIIARIARIKTRIAHSHQANIPEGTRVKLIRKIITPFSKLFATDLFACGKDAAIWMWGANAVNKGKVQIMNNAIEVDKFIFNPLTRAKLREELGIDGRFAIGNVARFSYQKNHEFLIRIFSEIYKVEKDAVLLLVGRGELENDVKKQVAELRLTEAVKFLGIRSDVPSILQALDVFLLPSRHEGLPVVLVEAQASSLMSIVADTVTKEIKTTDNIKFLGLEEPYSVWANEVLRNRKGYLRKDTSKEIKEAGYDIIEEAKRMDEYFKKVVLR